MDLSIITEMLNKHGLGACLSLAIFSMMFWLVKNIIKDQREERISYHKIITNHMSHNTEALNRIVNKFEESTRLNREEHREILINLKKLNGK